MRALLILAIVAGCYEPGTPQYSRCAIRCSIAEACPGDLECLEDGYCHATDDLAVCIEAEILRRDQLAAGDDHACGIRDGALACWGSNHFGQLGVLPSVTERSAVPLTVTIDGAGSWVAVATGRTSTCAVDGDGKLFCWGEGDNGRLGFGEVVMGAQAPREVAPPEPGRWLTVASGGEHTCALFRAGPSEPTGAAGDPGGALYCWGSGSSVGVVTPPPGPGGSRSGYLMPFRVDFPAIAGFADWLEIVANAAVGVPSQTGYTCARRRDGEVWCFGTGSASAAALDGDAALVGGGTKYARLAGGGDHVCAIERLDSSVACWGTDGFGQLGQDAITPFSTSPLDVDAGVLPGAEWRVVTAGDRHTCGLDTTGRVRCFGASELGQTGTRVSATVGSADLTGTDVFIGAQSRVARSLAAGKAFTCAEFDDGFECWGDNRHGQLGRAVFGDFATPAEVIVFNNGELILWDHVSAGARATCAVGHTVSGPSKLYCWGSAEDGIVGPGGDASAPREIILPGEQSVSRVDVGVTHACAVGDPGLGNLLCWGRADHGQLGGGVFDFQATLPPQYSLLSGVSDIALGDGFSCAISAGGVYCWGKGTNGCLGDGTSSDRPQPGTSIELLAAVGLAAGRDHVCARHDGGDMASCWGKNGNHEVSPNIINAELRPVTVLNVGPIGIAGIALGDTSTCLVNTSGELYCWGLGERGQVGLGIDAPAMPTPVVTTGRWSALVSAGSSGVCGEQAGALHCWGAGDLYPTGAFDAIDQNMPTAFTTWPSDIKLLDVGSRHACGIDKDTRLYCWGRNDDLTLGVGLGFAAFPQAVVQP